MAEKRRASDKRGRRKPRRAFWSRLIGKRNRRYALTTPMVACAVVEFLTLLTAIIEKLTGYQAPSNYLHHFSELELVGLVTAGKMLIDASGLLLGGGIAFLAEMHSIFSRDVGD